MSILKGMAEVCQPNRSRGLKRASPLLSVLLKWLESGKKISTDDESRKHLQFREISKKTDHSSKV